MYEKINLVNGDVLNDYHLNHLQEGILNIEKESKTFREKLIKILKAKGIPCSKDESFDLLAQKVNYLNGSYVPNDSEGEEGEENSAIDIRKTVKSGEIQIVFTDIQHGKANIALWTKDSSQYSVDWGDGTSGIYNNGETAEHQYVKGVGGEPLGESNTQWVATISCVGNQFYRFRTLNNSDMLWFASKDVYFEYMYSMMSGGETANHAPAKLKYFDMIGGGLGCDRDTNVAYCFRSCESLERISGTINLLGAKNAYQFFAYCRSLKELPTVLNLSSVTQASAFFQECNMLQAIPNLVSTENITECWSMFNGCFKIKEIPAMSLKSAINTNTMFQNCKELEDVRKLSDLGTSQNTSYMFRYCSNLKLVPNIMDMGSSTNCSWIFQDCQSLIDAPATMYLDTATNIDGMFYNCTALRTPPTTISAPNAINAGSLFYNCTSLRSLPRLLQLPRVQSANQLFYNCKSIRTAMDEIDFPEVLYLRQLFCGCDMLETPPRAIRVPKAIEVYDMFAHCYSLMSTPETLDITGAQKANSLFYECRILERANFTKLSLPSAIIIQNLFYNCRSLLEAPEIEAPIAQDINSMFYGCERMIKAKPLSFPRALAVNTFYYGCKALEEVPEINAPIATGWRQTYQEMPLLRKVATPCGGPAATDLYYILWNSGQKLQDIGNILDLTNVGVATYWLATNDPMHIKGPITIRGCKTDFYLRNCRSLTSIRFENMDPMCGNLDFRNCALEAEDINLLFGDLVTTNIPATINVAGNPGASTCNPEIATAKGWTVTKQ